MHFCTVYSAKRDDHTSPPVDVKQLLYSCGISLHFFHTGLYER